MSESREWTRFKDQVMEAAFRADEKSRLDMFERDAVAHELGIDASDVEQMGRLKVAVNQLVQEERLRGRNKFNDSLSL